MTHVNYAFGIVDPDSVKRRIDVPFIVEQGLHGGMYWDYSGDNGKHDLARTVADGLLK